jgi:hypothetical protein
MGLDDEEWDEAGVAVSTLEIEVLSGAKSYGS